MQITHKIELKPNNIQRTYFNKACGIARFTWNWALANWEKQYQLCQAHPTLQKPNGLALKKQFNVIKKQNFPWMYEVTKYASQQPFIHLQRAYNAFFKGHSKKPRFKKKGRARDSFYIGGDQIQVMKQSVRIPNLGWVSMRETLKYGGSINGVTISRRADRWYVSINVNVELTMIPCKNQAVVGVDLGINHLATLSSNTKIENSRPLTSQLRYLQRDQRILSKRKKRGSKNYNKIKLKIAKRHKRIADQRQNILHQLTRGLTKNYKSIAIEDLNVSGMMRNHKLARHIADVGFYEFRRQLEYKSKWYGNRLVLADRWFASSKTCSCCGEIKSDLSLKDREYHCAHCNNKQDRDLNAAINLCHLLNTESSSGIYALGQDGNAAIH